MELRHERSESARLDNFVDGAFAFAITLLIITGGSLPKTVPALEQALRGVPAFAACFAELAWFWHGHVRWRDTVGLTDRTSLLLSLLLVFFALIFVFPLHLVFASLFNGLSSGALSPGLDYANEDAVRATRALFVFYGLSFACMAGTLAALYRHAVRAVTRADLAEAIAIRMWALTWAFVAAVGLFSMALAALLNVRNAWAVSAPGFSYCLLFLLAPVTHLYRQHLEATLPP